NPSTPHTSLKPIPSIMGTAHRSHKPDNGLLGNAGKGIIIGLFSAVGSAVLVGLLLAVLYFFRCTRSGRILLDRLGRPGEYDDEQAFLREEAEALEAMDEVARGEYLRAKGTSIFVTREKDLEKKTDKECSLCRSQPARLDP